MKHPESSFKKFSGENKVMKNFFKLTNVAKQRVAFRRVLLSGAFATGLSFPVVGLELQYYDPDAFAGLPSIANHNDTYVFVDIDNDGDKDAFHQNVFFENIGSAAKPSYEQRASHLNPLANIPAAKLEFVDIDADGDLDVFIGSVKGGGFFESNIQWYENIGSASDPQYSQGDPFHLGGLEATKAKKLTFVDIDADGDFDVFLSEGRFYENTGTENAPFFIQQDVSNFSALISVMDQNSAVPIFVDWDNDGDLDALYPQNKGEFTDLIYLENTGNSAKGAIFQSSTVVTTFYGKSSDVAWQAVDIDNDLDDDLVINGITIFNRDSIGFDAFNLKRLQIPLGLSFANLDGDSDLDAFLVSQSSNKYKVRQFTNAGNMDFSLNPVSWPGEHITHPTLFATQFVDLDRDDDLDQIVEIDDSWRFFENIGTAKNPAMEERTGDDNPFNSTLFEKNLSNTVFVDIDFDGDLDMFVLVPIPPFTRTEMLISVRHGIIFYENVGTVDDAIYQQELPENPLIPDSVRMTSFAFSDVDLDGDQDLLMSDSNELIFLENIGGKYNPDFAFTEITASPFKDVSIPNFMGQLKFVDLDQNGYDDLIINDNLLYLTRLINQHDDDNDGLPNDWENENGLDPNDKNDAALDGDIDGFSNLEEFYAGTDPRDPTDYPGSSTQDPCQSSPISTVIHIDNKHYNSTDDITCQASTEITLEGNVLFSSGTQASFNAPLIQLKPFVSIPYGSNVTFSSQGMTTQ